VSLSINQDRSRHRCGAAGPGRAAEQDAQDGGVRGGPTPVPLHRRRPMLRPRSRLRRLLLLCQRRGAGGRPRRRRPRVVNGTGSFSQPQMKGLLCNFDFLRAVNRDVILLGFWNDRFYCTRMQSNFAVMFSSRMQSECCIGSLVGA
jgi:hypothetical protein